MENGFSTSDAVLTAAMSGNGFGNNRGGMGDWGGGGYGQHTGNQVLAAEAHANGTAVSAKADCNALRFSDGLNSLSDQFSAAASTAKFDRLNENISDQEFRSSATATALSKDIADAEFRTIDRNRDIERLVVQGQKEAAECCCDAKLEAAKNHASLLAGQAQILANQASDVRVSDAVANAVQNAKLDNILAERGRNHG